MSLLGHFNQLFNPRLWKPTTSENKNIQTGYRHKDGLIRYKGLKRPYEALINLSKLKKT